MKKNIIILFNQDFKIIGGIQIDYDGFVFSYTKDYYGREFMPRLKVIHDQYDVNHTIKLLKVLNLPSINVYCIQLPTKEEKINNWDYKVMKL